MPAHAIFDDLKPVQLNLDGEAREQLTALVRAEKSNKSAVVRRLIDQAYTAFLRNRLHSNEQFTKEKPVTEPADITA
jgi:hypothetical protein